MPNPTIPSTLDLPSLAQRLSTPDLAWSPELDDNYVRGAKLVGPQGQSVYLDVLTDRDAGKVHVSARPRRSEVVTRPYGYDSPAPETKVTLSRGTEALARAIEQKILPRLAEAVEAVEQGEARQREYDQATERAARMLTEAGITGLGLYPARGNVADRRRCYADIGEAQHATVEVSGNRVTLEFTVSAEAAVRAIRALQDAEERSDG